MEKERLDESDGTGVEEDPLDVGLNSEVVDPVGEDSGTDLLKLEDDEALGELEGNTEVEDDLESVGVGVKLESEVSLGQGTGNESLQLQLQEDSDTSEVVDHNVVDGAGVVDGVEESIGDEVSLGHGTVNESLQLDHTAELVDQIELDEAGVGVSTGEDDELLGNGPGKDHVIGKGV